MKKLLIYSIVSFCLFFIGLFLSTLTPENKTHSQTATNSHTEPLQSFEYKITYINHDGIYANSTKDSRKIFITPDKVKGIRLHVGDLIKVSFPKDNLYNITRVEKEETIVFNYH